MRILKSENIYIYNHDVYNNEYHGINKEIFNKLYKEVNKPTFCILSFNVCVVNCRDWIFTENNLWS
jgi:hypothetical protein